MASLVALIFEDGAIFLSVSIKGERDELASITDLLMQYLR
jgi:hypothetical protein